MGHGVRLHFPEHGGSLGSLPREPQRGTHLADAVDAHVAAGVHLVARCPVDDSVPQLFCKVFVLRPAVQLAGVNWGAQQAETKPEQLGAT